MNAAVAKLSKLHISNPHEELRHFYCTTYATYHGAIVPPASPPKQQTRKSGYSRNLIPYFLYDKQVDEGEFFRYGLSQHYKGWMSNLCPIQR
jgi:hypothetical protein